MSLLIDVLRRAEAGGAGPASTHPPPPAAPPRFELEPLADPAQTRAPRPSQSVPAQEAPEPAPSASALQRASLPSPVAPRWRQAGLSGCVSALATLGWLWLTPAPAASTATYAASAPSPASAEAAPPPGPVIPPAKLTPPGPHRTGAGRPPDTTAPRSTPAPPRPAIHFDRSPADAPPHAGVLTAAHAAYSAGDLPLAQARYREALASAPDNPDALDGLGAIALQEGQHELARQFFQRALIAHPLDPAALAGLARAERHDPMQAESRLKDSLTSQPDAIATHLALGDTLAAQQRWAEAQQAYFQAHRLAPEHPDIAYNLAVALDHLGQRRPAAGFYRKALQLAERRPARFPRNHCETRLQMLQAQDPKP